jgi:TolB-like protein
VLVAVVAICVGTAPAAAQSAETTTLAVLPLENNSGDATQDFFAGGMTDEIAVALAGVRGLGVVARSSTFQLKPSDRDSRAAGKALNAGHIVQGSARMRDDRVQVSLRLMRSSDGARLWSEDFDASLSEIFDLEEEIGRKIASALQLPVGADEKLIRSRARCRRISRFPPCQGGGAAARSGGAGERRCDPRKGG